MDLIKDFRNPIAARKISKEIHSIIGNNSYKIMEVCGGQTHTIYKYRLKEFLPEKLQLVSGPGCPVCVTPINYMDKAIHLSLETKATIFTFGDLIRVPGTNMTLEKAKAAGADIRTVYSPLQAVVFAKQNPTIETIFLGIGFETTVVPIGLSITEAYKHECKNFSVLLSAKRVPPVLDALLASEKIDLHGFITPGHVTAIIGTDAYNDICKKYSIPMVVGGFEPIDLLQAIKKLSELLVTHRCDNDNEYKRVSKQRGNIKAQAMIADVFESRDDELRGFGIIPNSGYKISKKYEMYDTDHKFPLTIKSVEPKGCICGQILSGLKGPSDCALFGGVCTPDSPIGACMVSNEGTCSAAFLYGE